MESPTRSGAAEAPATVENSPGGAGTVLMQYPDGIPPVPSAGTSPSVGPPQCLPSTSAEIPVMQELPPVDNFKVSRWKNRNFGVDSGVQTMVHSQTPSMMSYHHSQISTMSGMTEELAKQDLTEAQRSRFERLNLCSQGGENAASGVAELVQITKDPDEDMVGNALFIIGNVAKMDAEGNRERAIQGMYVIEALRDVIRTRANSPRVIRAALNALFHICSHPESLRSVVTLIGSDPQFLIDLVAQTRIPSCYKYALLSLHTILSDRSSSIVLAALAEARRAGAMNACTYWLEFEKSEKLLPIIVDFVRILLDRNNEQKELFIQFNGVSKLLKVLSNCRYENLLWRATNLLTKIAHFRPEAIVSWNPYDVLQHNLAHPSERLVMATLECLRLISDLRPEEIDLTPCISCLLRLFGHMNPKVLLYSTQTITNMIANHKTYKEFLVRENTVAGLVRILCESNSWMTIGEKEAELAEELQESVLSCIRHLSVRHDLVGQVQIAAMHYPGVLLEQLVKMRPNILKQALQILIQCASQNVNLEKFRTTEFVRIDPQAPINFVNQLVAILRVSCIHLPSVHVGMDLQIEGVKVADLIRFTTKVLSLLCRDRNGLLMEVFFYLTQPVNSFIDNMRVFLPLFIVQQGFIDDEAMRVGGIEFLLALAPHQEAVYIISSNQHLFYQLQTWSRSPNHLMAQNAMQALHTFFPRSAYPQPPSQGHHAPPPQGHYAPPPPQYPSSYPSTSRVPPVLYPPVPNEPSSPSGDWPEDLQIEGDPFAQVFCSPCTPSISPANPEIFDSYVTTDEIIDQVPPTTAIVPPTAPVIPPPTVTQAPPYPQYLPQGYGSS